VRGGKIGDFAVTPFAGAAEKRCNP